jgi:hypothetical protein
MTSKNKEIVCLMLSSVKVINFFDNLDTAKGDAQRGAKPRAPAIADERLAECASA